MMPALRSEPHALRPLSEKRGAAFQVFDAAEAYLDRLASVQYLFGRGLWFMSSNGAAVEGGKIAMLIVFCHTGTLAFAFEPLFLIHPALRPLRDSFIILLFGSMLASNYFLEVNSHLLRVTERARLECREDAASREADAWSLLRESFVLFLLSVGVFATTYGDLAA